MQQLFKVWFYSYSRGEASNASSGFEHIFIGEIDLKDGDETVSGFHNWIQFYFGMPPLRQLACIFIYSARSLHSTTLLHALPEERQGDLDYQGYVLPRRVGGAEPDGDEQFLSVQFAWKGETKPVSGMFVGVSPEFEFALYTLLFYCGQWSDNVLQLGDFEVNVR
eukprot:scaffold328826_cov32-Prasinocladus_malaysianus.AAC.1